MKYSSIHMLAVLCLLVSRPLAASPSDTGLTIPDIRPLGEVEPVTNDMDRFRIGLAYEQGHTLVSSSIFTDSEAFNTAGPSFVIECASLCLPGPRRKQPFTLGAYTGWRSSYAAADFDGSSGSATLVSHQARLGLSAQLRPRSLHWFWVHAHLGGLGAFIDARMSQEATRPDGRASRTETVERGWAYCLDTAIGLGIDKAVGREFWQRLGPYVEASYSPYCTSVRLQDRFMPPVVVDVEAVGLGLGFMMSL